MLKWLMYSALLASGYFFAGRLGQLLAVPPSYATAIWPASGIALAGILLLGNRVWPGLFLGAVLVNGWTPLWGADSFVAAGSSMLLPASISIGATAQALIGAYLIRRFVGFPNALIQDRLVLAFLALGGPVACFVGSSWGVASLVFFEVTDGSHVALNWWTWWVGDVIGVIIFAPATLIGFSHPRHIWKPRWLSVALPMGAAFAVTLVGFVSTRVFEQSRAKPEFERITSNALLQLEKELLRNQESLDSIESFFASSRKIERPEFASFNRRFVSRHSGIQAVAWLPIDEDEEPEDPSALPESEAPSVTLELAKRTFHEQSDSGELPGHLPIRYVEPEGFLKIEFNVASLPQFREAMQKCRSSGEHIATCPIQLDPTDARPSFIFIFAPSYSNNTSVRPLGSGRSLRGFILCVIDVEELVNAALPGSDSADFDFVIVDQSPECEEPLVHARLQDATPHKSSEVTTMLMQDIQFSATTGIADRSWLCSFTPTRFYQARQLNRRTWLILTTGLSLTALLGSFLLILSGRTARIKASESRYVDLYENAPDMFISVDVSQQRVIECNKTLIEATGYPRDKIVGQDLVELFDFDSRQEVLGALRLFLDGGSANDIELGLLCSDGHRIDTSMNVSAVRDPQGESIFCRAVLRDITTKKRIEAHLKNQEIELAHVARLAMMGEMATGLAHEINQPLAAIAAFAEGAAIRLRNGDANPQDLAKVVERISADAHRASEVIRRLRQFVRKREPDWHDLDMNELVREVGQFAGPDLKLRDVKLSLDLDADLPIIRGDVIQIQQVLLNLIRNGCDAMADTPPAQRNMVIRTGFDGISRVDVDVDDCGHGLSENMEEQVFEAFSSSREDGLGMGLAISRSIIESHGGRIWATPNLDGGASFHFSVPATEVISQDDQQTHSVSG
jgi:PAS domain S-box-containing protein